MTEKTEKVNESQIDILKPCPFCGSSNLNLYYKEVDSRGDPYHPTVRCNCCGTFLRFTDYIGDDREYRTLDDIVQVWNRRVNE